MDIYKDEDNPAYRIHKHVRDKNIYLHYKYRRQEREKTETPETTKTSCFGAECWCGWRNKWTGSKNVNDRNHSYEVEWS